MKEKGEILGRLNGIGAVSLRQKEFAVGKRSLFPIDGL
jgi:hypothetical protein